MSIDRRLAVLEDALEARKRANSLHAELDLAALDARLEAHERARQVFETLSVAEKIAAKEAELQGLREGEPDRLQQYRIRLTEIVIDQLNGVAAEVCEEQRQQAAATFSGRAYEKPDAWVRPVRETSKGEEGDLDEQPAEGHRPRRPALADARRMRDFLEDYRSTGRRWLEPDQV